MGLNSSKYIEDYDPVEIPDNESTALKVPDSNLTNPRVDTFSYSFTDSSIRMRKNGVPLIYKNKRHTRNDFDENNNLVEYGGCGNCAYGDRHSDPSKPYGFDLQNGNDNTAGYGWAKLTSECPNHLYWITNGIWRYRGDGNTTFRMEEWCGDLDPETEKSCLIGKYGTGKCSSNYSKGQDWGFNEDDSSNFLKLTVYSRQKDDHDRQIDSYPYPNTPYLIAANPHIRLKGPNAQDLTVWPTQYIFCNYKYDYTGYSYNNTGTYNGPSRLQKWTNDIYTPIQVASKIDAYRFRDATFIYTAIVDFYNQVYQQDYYLTNKITLQQSTSFLNGGASGSDALQACINNSTKTIGGILSTMFTTSNGIPPKGLVEAFPKILKFPTPHDQVNNVYTMTFNITWDMYTNSYKGKTQNIQDNFITTLINGMLNDSNIKLKNVNGNTELPNSSVVLNKTKFVSFTYIQLVSGISNGLNYVVDTDVDITKASIENYPNSMLTSVQILANISQWSPLLAVYFYIFAPTISYSPQVCNTIFAQTNIMPQGCLHALANNAQAMYNVCNTSVLPTDSYMHTSILDKAISGQNSNQCYCLTSGLAPASVANRVQNPAAMCFSKNCTDSDLSLNGLSDNVCKTHCGTVYDWMYNNSAGAEHPANPQEFDSQRFAEICPKYIPNIASTFDIPTAISSGIILIISSFTMFVYCKYKNKTSIVSFSLVLLVCVVVCALGIFLSLDLGAAGQCEGSPPDMSWVCKTKYTGIVVPNQFCKFVQTCECKKNSDCGGSGCICQSSICNPIRGIRGVQSVSKPNIILPYMFTSILAVILLPLCVKMKNIENKKIRKMLMVLSILFPVISLGLVLNNNDSVNILNPKSC